MKNKTFEEKLPPEYTAAFVFDAKDNKKTVLCMNIAAIAVTVVLFALFWMIIRPFDGIGSGEVQMSDLLGEMLPWYLTLIVSMIAYMILHELVHGAAYWLMTHHKLKFGLTLSVAYCGVPDIFVYRRAALIALLAPFCVFIPVFLIPMLTLSAPLYRLLAGLMLAIHIGGCAGDLYDTYLFVFRFRSPDTLMNDTGPRQTFYTK